MHTEERRQVLNVLQRWGLLRNDLCPQEVRARLHQARKEIEMTLKLPLDLTDQVLIKLRAGGLIYDVYRGREWQGSVSCTVSGEDARNAGPFDSLSYQVTDTEGEVTYKGRLESCLNLLVKQAEGGYDKWMD